MSLTKNIIPIFTVAIVLVITFISTIPATIKLLFTLFTVSFLFPVSREIIFKNKLRKIRVALYTTIIFSLGFLLFTDPGIFITIDFIVGFFIVLIFSSLGIFGYGIPASIIAELVSNKYDKYRSLISGFTHIGLGLFTGIIGLFSPIIDLAIFIVATICSIIFFFIDEYTKRGMKES